MFVLDVRAVQFNENPEIFTCDGLFINIAEHKIPFDATSWRQLRRRSSDSKLNSVLSITRTASTFVNREFLDTGNRSASHSEFRCIYPTCSIRLHLLHSMPARYVDIAGVASFFDITWMIVDCIARSFNFASRSTSFNLLGRCGAS